jgi:mono/diheme cytochrome c family protein
LTSGKNKAAVLAIAGLTLYGALFVTSALAGPPKKTTKKPPKKTEKSNQAAIEAGKKVYAANTCSGCHRIDGKGGAVGPDLTKTGADAKHTAKWFEVQIKTPKEHKADSAMPAYGDKIKGKDLTNLVAYLSSLKGGKK